MNNEILQNSSHLHVQQAHELWEFLGFETRNKYKILDENMQPVAFAAEANTGILGAILRLILKHWRSFEVQVFDNNRVLAYTAQFPFRWFFKTLILKEAGGKRLGHLQQRFGWFFFKKFDLHDGSGRLIGQIKSPLFKFWTFDVTMNGRKLGSIQKKWSGGLSEFFTDKDNFLVKYEPQHTDASLRALMMVTAVMVDIVYFENNRGSNMLDLGN